MNVGVKTVVITTTTANSYTQTFLSPGPLLLHVVYEAGSDLSSAADLSITDSLTGMPLLVAANFGSTAQVVYTPRRFINNAATGTESTSVLDYQAVSQKTTVTITGATASGQIGRLYLTYG